MSCAGNGYLSGNMLVSFPMKDGQFLAWAGNVDMSEAQMALERCFVDAAVHISGHIVPDGGWPALGRFRTSGSSLSFSLSVGESEVSMSVSASSVRFPVVRGTAPWGWYVVVLSSDGIKDFCESGFSPPVPSNSSPSGRGGGYWLDLCDRCVTVTPEGLSSIRVYDGVHSESSGPHFVLSGDISVAPGNNMVTSGSEQDNGIELAAVPGAGLGVLPCDCPEDTPLFQLASPDGHARLFNDTCHDFDIVSWSGNTATVRIYSKCTACCTCEMYESIVNDRLRALADVLKNVRGKLYKDNDSLLNAYKDAVDKFNKRMQAPTPPDVKVTITGTPVGLNLSPILGPRDDTSAKAIKGYMERCAFKVVVKNLSAYNIYVSLNGFIVSAKDGSPMEVIESSANWIDDEMNMHTDASNNASLQLVREALVGPGKTLDMWFLSRKKRKVSRVDTATGYSAEVQLFVWGRDGNGGAVYLGDNNTGNLYRSVEV